MQHQNLFVFHIETKAHFDQFLQKWSSPNFTTNPKTTIKLPFEHEDDFQLHQKLQIFLNQ